MLLINFLPNKMELPSKLLEQIAVNTRPKIEEHMLVVMDKSSHEEHLYQTLQNYLKVSVGNDTYNLTKYDKIQITDTTVIKVGNSGGYLLPRWKIVCNDKNNISRITNFVRSTRTNSPTGESGATSLAPIGDSFM